MSIPILYVCYPSLPLKLQVTQPAMAKAAITMQSSE